MVTGGSRGIGAVVAVLAAARGENVAVNYAGDERSARAVVETIERSGGRAIAIRADVASEGDVERLFADAEGALGPLSGLVTAEIGGANEWVHYAASKGASETFTRGLGREVAAEGIRVNAVSPGLIATELHARAGAPQRLEKLAPSLPIGRVGTPEEVAEAIVWLLSPAASYVTAAVLHVSGGR